MKDIQLVEAETCVIEPRILNKTQSDGLRLYQKILVLLLSSKESAYRELAGTQLIKLLQGANIPDDNLLQSIGISACAAVTSLLDLQDLLLLASLNATASNGLLTVTVTLKNGLTYTGALT